MILQDSHGSPRARRAWTTLKIIGLVYTAAFGLAHSAAALSPPSVGPVTSSAGGSGVARYGKLDLAFSAKTSAVSPFLPYDPVAPSYVANLRPTEDARLGVSVDGLFLPPGQTDWGKALVQPGFYQDDYDSSGASLGTSGWHVRFAPTQVGQWQYEVRITDAGGSATTAPAAFTCTASASHGFLNVSPTDSRYFEFSDGTPFLAAGLNGFGDPVSTIQSLGNAHATGLIRLWLASTGGCFLTGGWADNPLSSHIQGYAAALYGSDAHSGRYSAQIMPGNQVTYSFPTSAGNYTTTAYVKAVGTDAGATASIHLSNSSSVIPADGAWHMITGTYTHDEHPNTSTLGISLSGTTRGFLLVDDITVTGPGGYDLLCGDGSFEWHTHYNQSVAAGLDTIVDAAQANGQYLKLVCLEKHDRAWGQIGPDGSPQGFATSNAEGGSGDPAAGVDTAVRRLQRYYARYLMARWGYATAVHSFEYVNEGGEFINDGVHFAGAQAFAAAIHSYAAMGRRLASSSCVDNTSSRSYAVGFYENPAYPDIDYADEHFYPQASEAWGAFLPYQETAGQVGTLAIPNGSNVIRIPTGGPGGTGQLMMRPNGQASTKCDFGLPTLRGQGVWTVSFWYKSSPDVTFGSASSYVQVHFADLPGGYQVVGGSLPRTPVAGWTQYSGTFTVSGDGGHSDGLLMLYGQTATGTASFADLRLTAPDGRVFYRLTFDEPTYDQDSASMVSCLGLAHASASGDPSIGKPLVLGELDLLGSPPPDAAIPDYARGAAWGQLNASGATPLFWQNSAAKITQAGAWKYAAAAQAFMAGVPLSNGHFRELGASVTNTTPSASPVLRLIGQKDVQDGLAYFWAQNRGRAGDTSDTADWGNIAANPGAIAPVSATVSVPGLPDGAYQVEMWDTTSGDVMATQVLTSQAGVLPVPISGLLTDTAFKIYPASAPRLAVHLSADKTVVKSGDIVNYTLAYTNQGTTPALGVNVPWTVPNHMAFVSAPGGTYDAQRNTVTWLIGAIAPGASGSLSLAARVK